MVSWPTWPHMSSPSRTAAGTAVPDSEKAGVALRDEVAIACLDRAHVDNFEAIGFERNKVVCTTTLVVDMPDLHSYRFADSDQRIVALKLQQRLDYFYLRLSDR
jgi:hypothetical protein